MFDTTQIFSKRGRLNSIWQAAHWERTLTRTVILGTDLKKTIRVIADPKEEITLRISGHLLLGVARIHDKKASLLFSDCHDSLKKLRLHSSKSQAVDRKDEPQAASTKLARTNKDVFTMEEEDEEIIPEPTRVALARPQDITLDNRVASVDIALFDDEIEMNHGVAIDDVDIAQPISKDGEHHHLAASILEESNIDIDDFQANKMALPVVDDTLPPDTIAPNALTTESQIPTDLPPIDDIPLDDVMDMPIMDDMPPIDEIPMDDLLPPIDDVAMDVPMDGDLPPMDDLVMPPDDNGENMENIAKLPEVTSEKREVEDDEVIKDLPIVHDDVDISQVSDRAQTQRKFFALSQPRSLLESTPPVVTQAKSQKKRPRDTLVVDHEIRIPSETMKKNLQDTSDIIISREERKRRANKHTKFQWPTYRPTPNLASELDTLRAGALVFTKSLEELQRLRAIRSIGLEAYIKQNDIPRGPERDVTLLPDQKKQKKNDEDVPEEIVEFLEDAPMDMPPLDDPIAEMPMDEPVPDFDQFDPATQQPEMDNWDVPVVDEVAEAFRQEGEGIKPESVDGITLAEALAAPQDELEEPEDSQNENEDVLTARSNKTLAFIKKLHDQSLEDHLSMLTVLHGENKKTAAGLFFQCLVLQTRGYIRVQQASLNGDISIRKGQRWGDDVEISQPVEEIEDSLEF